MENVALTLFIDALRTAVILALVPVCVVAAIGVAVGLVQTVVQVQDQNVSFAPKLAALAILAAICGPAAFEVLLALLARALAALPVIART